MLKKNTCRWCWESNLSKILELWNMPLAWWFLKSEEISIESKIPLDLYFCNNCNLVQICDVVDPEKLFKKYFYISSVIPQLAKHFAEYYNFLKTNYLTSNSKLLEIWCNDWVLMQNFLNDKDITVIWIDPSENVCKLANEKWINVINNFFTNNSALNLHNEFWDFDVVTWSNVFAHVDDIIDIINGAKTLIWDKWVFIFEVHYLLDLMKDFQYDTIYHEHLTYYSVIAAKKIFELQWMKIIDVIHLDMHWWWIRVVTCSKESVRLVKDSVQSFIVNEIRLWLNIESTFNNFWEKVKAHKNNLNNLLSDIKAQWKTIVWYWAPWRWTILLNYCWIDNKILDYIVDLSPLRKWMLMPWVHVEIVDPKVARDNPPDYFLVLAWNYIDSILEQEKELINKWVKFIIPFPEIKII